MCNVQEHRQQPACMCMSNGYVRSQQAQRSPQGKPMQAVAPGLVEAPVKALPAACALSWGCEGGFCWGLINPIVATEWPVALPARQGLLQCLTALHTIRLNMTASSYHVYTPFGQNVSVCAAARHPCSYGTRAKIF